MKLKNLIKTYKNAGMRRIIRGITEKVSEYWYETRFGIDSSGRIEVEELNKTVKDDNFKDFGVVFASTTFEWMRKGINSLPININNSTLLDLGSGKGRILSFALQKGFRKVIGVEYSPELYEIIKSNLKKLDKAKAGLNWQIINCDAMKYEIPSEIDVIWMFNPFKGPVLEKVLANCKIAGQKKDVYILFANPPEEKVTSNYLSLIKKNQTKVSKIVFV